MAIKDSSGDNAPANTGKKDNILICHTVNTNIKFSKHNKKRPNGRF